MIRELNEVEVSNVSGGMEEVKVVARQLVNEWVTSLDPNSFGGEHLRQQYHDAFMSSITDALNRNSAQSQAEACAAVLQAALDVTARNRLTMTPNMSQTFQASCNSLVANATIWANKSGAHLNAIGIN